jgi:hypothetical protein
MALAGAACMTLGIVLLPQAAGAAAAPNAAFAAGAARPAPSVPSGTPGTPTASAPAGLSRTVRGPRMWDPAASRLFTRSSSVTVSQTANLVNEEVQVSWRGFTPSSELLYDPNATNYPVMVAECRGIHPTAFQQCFGADNGGVAGSFSAYGPMNTAYSTTTPGGAGRVEIQLVTGQQNQLLGCDIGRPCSLVIVPSQGGNVFVSPPRCKDHSQDLAQSDIGAIAFSSATGQCSWRDRIIVPLYFEPTPTDCPIASASFSAIGSPMAERAMASWQAALCTAASPMTIQYDSQQNEPLARQDFLSGSDDLAFTTLPADTGGSKPFTYAPVAISAESIAYWIDNPKTGQPITHLKLNQRLLAKLLTQSYNFDNEGCGHGAAPKGVGCDNAVDNNPVNLFADPEFKRLNPGVASVGDGYQVPTVASGNSDMTYEVTRWIAANTAAKNFVNGSFDPWGEHVNTDYLNLPIPTDAFTSRDAYPLIAHRYTPVFPLSQVAQYQAENWYPATNWQLQLGNYPKLVPEVPGDRALLAIVDQGDAAAYRFPVAAIPNHAGAYVRPTAATMAAALADMSSSGSRITRQIAVKAKGKNDYPLTMVIYAMVPTGGISAKKAARIAQFLDFVANLGQAPGNAPGQLPPGYLPLTAKMRAQTLKAASEVLNRTGDKHQHKQHKHSVAPASTAPATPTPSPSPSATSHRDVSLGFITNPATSGVARFALPILLVTGGLLALAGSSALVVGRAGAVMVTRLRRLRLRRLRLRRPGRKQKP